jgi:hypothetical protein
MNDETVLASILKRLENPEQKPMPMVRPRDGSLSTGFRRDGELFFSPEGERITGANIHRMPGAFNFIFKERLAKENNPTLVKPIGNPPTSNPIPLEPIKPTGGAFMGSPVPLKITKPAWSPSSGNPTSLNVAGNPSTSNSTGSYWELINNPETPIGVKPLIPSKGYDSAILAQKFVNYLLQRGGI